MCSVVCALCSADPTPRRSGSVCVSLPLPAPIGHVLTRHRPPSSHLEQCEHPLCSSGLDPCFHSQTSVGQRCFCQPRIQTKLIKNFPMYHRCRWQFIKTRWNMEQLCAPYSRWFYCHISQFLVVVVMYFTFGECYKLIYAVRDIRWSVHSKNVQS